MSSFYFVHLSAVYFSQHYFIKNCHNSCGLLWKYKDTDLDLSNQILEVLHWTKHLKKFFLHIEPSIKKEFYQFLLYHKIRQCIELVDFHSTR